MTAKMLLIDDDPLVLKSLQVFFQSKGHLIYGCKSGQEALSIFERESVDLIISDIRMHSMNGVEVIQRIREIEKQKNIPETPVIMMTAYADERAHQEAHSLNLRDFFHKPFDISDLIQSVERCLVHSGFKV